MNFSCNLFDDDIQNTHLINKSNHSIARSNSQDQMINNSKYCKFAKKENIQFRITRNNCNDLSKYMRWKADNQIVLDRLLMIDKSINQ